MATRRSWFTFTQVSNLKRKRELSFVISGKNPRIEFTELTCFMCPFLKQLLLLLFKRMESIAWPPWVTDYSYYWG